VGRFLVHHCVLVALAGIGISCYGSTRPLEANGLDAGIADVSSDGACTQANSLPDEGRADCRTTICKVELSHEGAEDYRVFVTSLIGAWPGAMLAGKSRASGPEGWDMTIFLGKPGEPLPLVRE
jgi:hypothetical protein